MDKRQEIKKMVDEWHSENNERATFVMLRDEKGEIVLIHGGRRLKFTTALTCVINSDKAIYDDTVAAIMISANQKGMKERLKTAWMILKGIA